MRCGLTWKIDPGPCPVDDTPHTACTPASIAAKGGIVAPGYRPRVLPVVPAAPLRPGVVVEAPVAEPPSTQVGPPFSTKTYKRPQPTPRKR